MEPARLERKSAQEFWWVSGTERIPGFVTDQGYELPNALVRHPRMSKELRHDHSGLPVVPESSDIPWLFSSRREATCELCPVAFTEADGQGITVVSPLFPEMSEPLTGRVLQPCVVLLPRHPEPPPVGHRPVGFRLLAERVQIGKESRTAN